MGNPGDAPGSGKELPGLGPDDDDEVERLRAEVAELEAKVDRTEHRHHVGRSLRKFGVGVLVVLTAFSFTAGAVGVWASRNFLNNDVFASRIGTVIEEQAVQQALARFTTAEVMKLVDVENLIAEALPDQAQILAPTLAGAVEDFVRGKVEEVFATPEFAALFETVVNTAHQQAVDLLEGNKSEVVTASGDSVTLNFLPVINQVLAKIGDVSPEILGRDVDIPTVTVDDVPDAARQKISEALGVNLDDNFGTITVYDAGALQAAQDGIALFNKVVWLLVGLTIILIPLTLWLSTHRRRTLLQLVVAISVGMVIIRRVSLRLQGDLLNLVRIPENVPAVQITTDRVVDPLRLGAEIVLWIALAIVVIALLTGPYPWAVSLRARVASLFSMAAGTAKDPATADWVLAHRDALLWVGAGVGVVALWFFDLSWLTFFALVLVVGAYELAVVRLADRARGGEAESGPVPPVPAEQST